MSVAEVLGGDTVNDVLGAADRRCDQHEIWEIKLSDRSWRQVLQRSFRGLDLAEAVGPQLSIWLRLGDIG